ncbi:MAG TPA: triphosphoribosyl-dephospho-CoA synthase, partial [Anaerolineae bacterium]|nr:triphosphoribosyl-dephospho-CoA synthase [Anaerolineae bacterium]
MNPFTLPLQPLKQATDLPHLAINALILEPHLYPHLGLVAPHHNGAHHDMNYPLLVHSAHALTPYFHATLHLGLHPPPQRP